MKLGNISSPAEYRACFRLYRAAFPRAERKPFLQLLRARRRGKAELLGVFDDADTLCGIAILLKNDTHALLDYFAVMPKKRGDGIGSRALALLRDHCGERRFLLEIEQCDIPCENKEQRLRRRRFYLRNGMQPSGMLVLQNGVRLEVLCCGGDTSFAQYHTLIREGYGQRVAAKTTLLSENNGGAR